MIQDIKLTLDKSPYKCRIEVNGEPVLVFRAFLLITPDSTPTLTLEIPIVKPMVIQGEVNTEVTFAQPSDALGRMVYQQLKERYEDK